jgi:hypothetical protein
MQGRRRLLPPLVGQPDQPGLHGQRLPAGDSTRAFPRLRGVGHAREQAAQLRGGREFATLLEWVRMAAASASVTTNIREAWDRGT